MFDYSGDACWRQPITDALTQVIDPEVGLSILDVGLVYTVTVTPDVPAAVHVLMTMTSAACPMAGLLIDDVQAELRHALPPSMAIEVSLCWEPPWTPERMSEHAQQSLGW